MELKNFNQALTLAIERYTTTKKYLKEIDKYEKISDYSEKKYEFEVECRDYMLDTNSFFVKILPKFIKKNKIEGEELIKLARIMLKTAELIYLDDYDDNLNCYFNKKIMKDKSLLNDLIKVYNRNNLQKFYVERILVKYNFEYLENYILSNKNLDEITQFAIEYKKNSKLNLKQFENKILDKGSFENLYDYLYEVKDCNQKAILTRILEIATLKELKKFSHADEDRKKMDEETSDAYSSGYSMGLDPY